MSDEFYNVYLNVRWGWRRPHHFGQAGIQMPAACWKIGNYITCCQPFIKCGIACVDCLELFLIDYLVCNRITDQVAMIDFYFTARDYKKPCECYFCFTDQLHSEHWSVSEHYRYCTVCTLRSHWRYFSWEKSGDRSLNTKQSSSAYLQCLLNITGPPVKNKLQS